LSAEKRADWLIEQLAPLRSKIDNLHLHIVGNQSFLQTEQQYYQRLSPLVAANKDWVTLHENIPRQELTELASRQRYGIHARVDEHFGIAVAEMVRAGCIPLVHNSGGQVEIVRRDPRLIFKDDELTDKLLHVANTTSEHDELRSMLASQAELFTPERFMCETRKVVHQVLG
jgi:glycosyltransferase involved in cell wall biosynthesis